MYSRIVSQPGMDKSRVTMIHNAIPVDQFYKPEQRDYYRAKLGLPSDALIVGYAGQNSKGKADRSITVSLFQCIFTISSSPTYYRWRRGFTT